MMSILKIPIQGQTTQVTKLQACKVINWKKKRLDETNEVQRQPDLDYEEMLDELESHVHSESDQDR